MSDRDAAFSSKASDSFFENNLRYTFVKSLNGQLESSFHVVRKSMFHFICLVFNKKKKRTMHKNFLFITADQFSLYMLAGKKKINNV